MVVARDYDFFRGEYLMFKLANSSANQKIEINDITCLHRVQTTTKRGSTSRARARISSPCQCHAGTWVESKAWSLHGKANAAESKESLVLLLFGARSNPECGSDRRSQEVVHFHPFSKVFRARNSEICNASVLSK